MYTDPGQTRRGRSLIARGNRFQGWGPQVGWHRCHWRPCHFLSVAAATGWAGVRDHSLTTVEPTAYGLDSHSNQAQRAHRGWMGCELESKSRAIATTSPATSGWAIGVQVRHALVALLLAGCGWQPVCLARQGPRGRPKRHDRRVHRRWPGQKQERKGASDRRCCFNGRRVVRSARISNGDYVRGHAEPGRFGHRNSGGARQLAGDGDP